MLWYIFENNYVKYICWFELQLKHITVLSGNRWHTKLLFFLFGLHYGNMGCRFSKGRAQIWKVFYLKFNIPKENYWIFRISVTGRSQKVPKLDFQSLFLRHKVIEIFLNFFSLKNINLVVHCFLFNIVYFLQKDDIMLHFTLSWSSDITE